ncbi:hypothetical protein DRW07_02115 [Alteromonas sediminis]|uniref:Uncharacterized protein n=1 Tax=Alteromonas sediminis TaxID=2259342 RepID=A0A3N5Y5C3_9ALTE|nr:hypothetical protein [Alteromonas sediminis]RPJ68226.1 hypothetical protein DRW07_02115 [Alteromonas sediminis]
MENQYVNATLAENFFIRLGNIFHCESDFINALHIRTEGNNYEALYALFAQHAALNFSNEELVLLRTILSVVCSDTALHGEPGDDLEESHLDDEPLQLQFDFGRDKIPF